MFVLKEIFNGKSVARSLFNFELSQYSLSGVVLDIGGGKHQDYLKFLKINENTKIVTVDIDKRNDGITKIDFEKDALPFEDKSIDQVLVFNVLEHIFNYNLLAREMFRVLKDDSKLLGFVPFLVNYHPDPHDYFRYTREALNKIFLDAGFREIVIKEIGRGPFTVNYNNIMLSFPLFMRVILFPFYYMIDSVFLWIRPKIKNRYPLGFIFILKK